MFPDFSNFEVYWDIIEDISANLFRENNLWNFKNFSDTIANRTDYSVESNSTILVDKSYYSATIQISRNPTEPIIFVVFPAVIICIFNIFACILGMEGGKIN